MSRIRRVLSLSILLVFILTTVLPALAASEHEDAMVRAMRSALAKTGMQPKAASNAAQQNVFFGIVMLKDVQRQILGDRRAREKLLAQAERVGTALGAVLGGAFNAYGSKKMQEAPVVMMHAVRAGMIPEAVAETFSALAQNGYAFDAAKHVIHEASEVVRSEKLADAGVGLCRDIRKIVAQKGSVQNLQREIVLAAKAEKARQRALLAKNEAERKKLDGGNETSNRVAERAASTATPASSPSRGTGRTAAGDTSPAAAGKADGSAASKTGSEAAAPSTGAAAGGSSTGAASSSGTGSGGASDASGAGSAGGASDGKSGADSGSAQSGGNAPGGSDGNASSGTADGSGGASDASGAGSAGNASDGKSGSGSGSAQSGGHAPGESDGNASSGTAGGSGGASGTSGAGSAGSASDGKSASGSGSAQSGGHAAGSNGSSDGNDGKSGAGSSASDGSAGGDAGSPAE